MAAEPQYVWIVRSLANPSVVRAYTGGYELYDRYVSSEERLMDDFNSHISRWDQIGENSWEHVGGCAWAPWVHTAFRLDKIAIEPFKGE